MHLRSIRSIGLTLALVVAGLASRPSVGQQKKSGGDKYALLVGVRKYDPNELRGLPYSEPDVVELSSVLKAEGYKPGNVVLMTQTAGADDTRFLPLAANVRKELKLLLDEVDEDDSVLIALAGHGVQFQGENESYFCPADARLADKSTLIPLSEIYKALENSRAGLKVLLVDACRNDPQSQNSRDREVVKLESVTRPQRTPPPGGVVAFFSCSEGEKAFEHAELKHGVFFHFVIQALKGAAVGPDQNDVLVLDVVKYVTRQVKDFVRENYGVKQQPDMKGTIRDLVPLVSLGPRSLSTARGTALLAVFWRPIGESLAAGLKRPPAQPQVAFVVPGGGGDHLGLRVCSKSLCCGPSPWSLVPKPIPVLRPGQPTEHQLNHADPDLRLAGISQVFIILAVNPAPTQPAEGSLHHPPPRQQLKPSVPGRSADDLNHIPPVLRDPSVQGVIVVLGVRPQLPQARERFARQLAEDLRCRRRIIHGRTGDGHG